MTVFVERFELLLDHHMLYDGISYTDAHITAGGLLFVAGALVLGAIIAAINAVRDSRVAGIVVSVLLAVLCYWVLTIVGWHVSNFVVKPNQLVREEPYITNNIQMTRQAYGLDVRSGQA